MHLTSAIQSLRIDNQVYQSIFIPLIYVHSINISSLGFGGWRFMIGGSRDGVRRFRGSGFGGFGARRSWFGGRSLGAWGSKV